MLAAVRVESEKEDLEGRLAVAAMAVAGNVEVVIFNGSLVLRNEVQMHSTRADT